MCVHCVQQIKLLYQSEHNCTIVYTLLFTIVEWLTQCGAGKKTARRYMSNAFSLSSKGSGCLIFAPNYLTNCVTYYGAKIIHQDSLEDCKKVLDIKRRAVFLPAPHCVNHSTTLKFVKYPNFVKFSSPDRGHLA